MALATRGPVCVLAGAGTGKTRAITYRIAYAGRDRRGGPGARARADLHRARRRGTARPAPRARRRTVRASTFHAAALRQLNYFWPRVVGGRPPQLVESKAGLVREAARRAAGPARGRARSLADAAAEIEWAKVIQVRPDGYVRAAPRSRGRRGRSAAAGADSLAAVYAAYEDLRRDRHLIDFESVLELTAAILLDSRAAADQVRDTFRYFVVDEYQDVNPLQKLLLDAWLGDRDDLCVVGDPHQVIYSFTGATPSYLTGFTAEFPGATVVRLVRDYRSTPQVVAVANRLIRSRPGAAGRAAPGRAPSRCSPSTPTTRRRRPGWPPGPGADRGGRPGRRRSRCWSGSTPTPSGSSRRWPRPGVPYVVRGAERFYERPEVRQALVLLRGAARGERGRDRGGRRVRRSAARRGPARADRHRA